MNCILASLIIVVSVRSSSVRSVTLWFYPRKPPVPRSMASTPGLTYGARDLPIKNGLAETVRGEHIRYRTLAQGGAGNRKPYHRELGAVRRI